MKLRWRTREKKDVLLVFKECPFFRSSSALNLALSEAACHAYAHIPPHALPPCPPAAHARQDHILAHRQVVVSVVLAVAAVIVLVVDPSDL